MRTTHSEKYVSTLNEFLRGEISAVETYSLAISQLGGDANSTLRENHDCHSRRIILLRDKIIDAGGQPDTTSGAWGGFAKLVEKSASLAGKKAVYAALEEGEDHGLKEYRDTDNVDDAVNEVIHAHLLPAQERTHDRMRILKNTTV